MMISRHTIPKWDKVLMALVAVSCGQYRGPVTTLLANETEGVAFLQGYDVQGSQLCNGATVAAWNYNTDITPENQNLSVQASLEFGAYQKEVWQNVSLYDWNNFQDPSTKRQFQVLSVVGTSALPDSRLSLFENTVSTMEGIYSTTKICDYKNPSKCDLPLDPDLTAIMANSRDFDELLYVWQQWHTGAGRPIKAYYIPYVTLGNEAAVANGLSDYGALWRYPYETDTFPDDVAALWEQLKPFYQQLHAYVRKKLVAFYGADKVNRTGPLPAHILGNMWAQDWTNVLDLTQPFPNATTIDITDALVKQNYTVRRMFDTAEEFFTSITLNKMPQSFWDLSMLERPTGREVVCHASAWDFCDRQDVRIKMCTTITHDDFITIHHEMGHIQYYQEYKDQPLTFRDGANPGFHEAIGDTIALSVSTPSHLYTIGLLDSPSQSNDDDLNFLFRMALDKVAFLPFGYLIDLWRWKVFAGEITPNQWNDEFWAIRRELQGVYPFIPRSDVDFDAGAKYHVPADSAYMSYFVSSILQQMFHKSLCQTAGQYDPEDPSKPLHKCDIYRSTDAGEKLASGLKLGYSQPWPDTLELLTGQRNMDAGPLLEYFKPLIDFLTEDNAATGEVIGWE